MAIVVWRLESKVYWAFVEIIADMEDEEEWSERYMDLLEQIKTLPGYPLTLNEETDMLIVEEVGSVKSLATVN